MRRGALWILGVYCLLEASEWLLPPLPLRVRALVFAVVGIAAAASQARRRWNGWRELGQLAFAAVLLIGVPELLSRWAIQHVSGAMSTAVLGFVPVILVLVVAQENAGARRLLVPAVVGLGGILLLIPVSVAGSLLGRIAVLVLACAAVLVALASVRIHRLLQRFGIVQAVAVVCLANAVLLLGAGFVVGGTFAVEGAWSSVAVTGVEVVLLVVLLREITPVRLGARFFVIPMLTILEGAVLLRFEVTTRMVLGASLLAGGAMVLLLSRETEEEPSLSLR